jgi:large subunit ribosomal protein L35
MQKRFKLTASGKAKHKSAFRGHLLSHKSGKKKRQLRKDGIISGRALVTIRDGLRPGK